MKLCRLQGGHARGWHEVDSSSHKIIDRRCLSFPLPFVPPPQPRHLSSGAAAGVAASCPVADPKGR